MEEQAGRTSVKSLQELLHLVQQRCSKEEDIALITRAYQLAEAAHRNQTRASGEPYITHPLAVAGILAEYGLDAPAIAAALLHDVVEDTTVTLPEIRNQFGEKVAELVDALTKISRAEIANVKAPLAASETEETESAPYRTQREAESLRKMLLGLANDLRVVLIKLADRLHNMRTLDTMPPEKQRRIARETLDLYAPLANRLGLWKWKQELEELGFRYAYPEQYAYLKQMLAEGEAEREARIQRYIAQLRAALAEEGITNVEITGRAKHIYSIWRKMQRKNLSFDKIRDTHAIRVIVEDDAVAPPANGNAEGGDKPPTQPKSHPAVHLCYVVLGIVHRLWRQIPGEFNDYISHPKDNHYQSIHTAVIDEEGRTLEVQIRTRTMHLTAEHGVAAHWLYKDDSRFISKEYREYIERLRESLRTLGNETESAVDFVEAVRTDHLRETVFCFTPKGKLIELPLGSTVIDFAYRIHTEIGDHCRGAKVNGRMVPLNYKLQNGDVVEIITHPSATPRREWVHDTAYVFTSAARHKIRQWFRRQDREQNIRAGREIVERELKRLGVAHWMKLEDVYRLYVRPEEESDGRTLENFLERVGLGHITQNSIASRIMEEERRRERQRREQQAQQEGQTLAVEELRVQSPKHSAERKGRFIVKGVPDSVCRVAKCCNPQPNDDVVGYVTRGQGVTVHKRACRNVANLEPERLVEVVFASEEDVRSACAVSVRVVAADRPGLVADIASVIASHKGNITNIHTPQRNAKRGDVHVEVRVELPHPKFITDLLNALRRVHNVFEVVRLAT
ncbi:MAG: bifunctional (p)ppGpp synthetase/guanosine-3',5'-bis(diphosphate) 3'-pyrophosphohydrolase [Thermoflexales bacterium]|nr:bifunctional (p)ppGpp synthetase/guanosine-3',5'-bis(diphosphate) 3'-pyrophosphohydrolase [Thermoflexales bacterium]MCS7324454.1 bifunctional (p)ppGpp synthetase/guanosine-3',5'-bis(diphosphate) 3'-pyrophosphohydrolase [Thermoflexales bacterium]MCX7939679.1 bifunctional (p)ppGpp synthetase/guanosine-3',5'-bis(diphosphate) 3'-pyrophosphohydrolase [Thermoflexales bacterium]MDW8054273.1 bifunctional (p)ppGpp synthetase/guanosine-3',5'-bis(diphosphate) 3'-pyrophosphohydrolase [Anaerolineae bacter